MSGAKKEAMYYEKAAGGVVSCGLCPHNCHILPGGTGKCRVRRNEGGALYAISYGEVSSLALDPIEKKPLYRFQPGSMILSAGSYGCNFRCPFCQNHTISMERPRTAYVPPQELAGKAAELIKEGNIGVAYTYNEPLIGFEYVLDCARVIHAMGMKNVLVTNGFVSQAPLLEILPYINAMNIDIKGSAGFYSRLCGGCAEDVWRTVELSAGRCHVEVTTLIIPGENDSEEEISETAKRLKRIDENIPLHITRFYPRYKMTDKPAASVLETRALAAVAGEYLKYVVI